MTDTILNELKKAQIVSFELDKTNKLLTITEECDNYFSVSLTKLAVLNFITELSAIYNQMEV